MIKEYFSVHLTILCTALIILIGLSNIEAQFVHNPDNGHYYGIKSLRDSFSWIDAQSEAEAQTFMGITGHLGTITSAEELNFIMTHVLPAHSAAEIWLGGELFEGNWQWVTGEPFDPLHGIDATLDVQTEASALVMRQDGSWQTSSQWSSMPTAYMVEFDVPSLGDPDSPIAFPLPIDDPIQSIRPVPLPIPLPEPFRFCDKLMNVNGHYGDGNLELAFDLNIDRAVTWNVWLVMHNAFKSLLSVDFPDQTDNAFFFPITLPSFSPSGNIGVLTTLATPTSGIYCSTFTTIDTGGQTTE